MDSRQPQEAKPEVPSRGSPVGVPQSGIDTSGGAVVRRYPKPPPILLRLIMMCIRPETWAEVARYPTRFTIVPLLLAVVFAAVVVGYSESARLIANLRNFAVGYDKQYPPLHFSSDGVLQVKGELANPMRFEDPSNSSAFAVLVDPTGKTVPESIKSSVLFVTDKEILTMPSGGDGMISRMPLSNLYTVPPLSMIFTAPPAGESKIIDSAHMESFLNEKGRGIGLLVGTMTTLLLCMGNALWAAFMMFLVSPLIMLAAAGGIKAGDGPDRRLLLPRRAAYRMAGAIVVPLLMLGAGLQASGHPVMHLLGPQGSTLFWFFSASALAIWTGIMARKMYGPKEAPRRAK